MFQDLPTNTHQLHVESDIVYGQCDGIEAMKQAIYLLLSIERYQYPIYSWNYGVELADLFGKPLSFVLPELERRIKEALVQDSRIQSVEGFDFATEKGIVCCTFTVRTIYGAIQMEKEVPV